MASEYHGHMTLSDGSHVPLTADEAEAIWEASERQRAERAIKLPDEKSCRDAMFDAFDRMREFGWREAIYCPKDGTVFDAIEAGSTGVFDCYYDGEWPKGSWWAYDGGDLWPSRPILFRLKQESTTGLSQHSSSTNAAESAESSDAETTGTSHAKG